MVDEIICPFIIDDFGLSDEDIRKIEIALVLINAELSRKKKERLNFIGKIYYPFYIIPITHKVGTIFDTLNLFSAKVRIKDIETILQMDPDTNLDDPNSDRFIEQIKEFSKRVENITRSRGEKISLNGLVYSDFIDELEVFVSNPIIVQDNIIKIEKVLKKREVLDLSELFSRLFQLKLGKFLDYEMKTIHSINSALINIYEKYQNIINDYDLQINNLDYVVESINKSLSINEIIKFQSDYELKYSEYNKEKNYKINNLDKNERVLYNSKDRLHDSYSRLIKYVLEIQQEIEDFGIILKDDLEIENNTPITMYLPIYIVEYTNKKSRFHYIAPFHLKEQKKQTQIIEHNKAFKEFESLIEKNYGSNLFYGLQKSDINNILDDREEIHQLFNGGINILGDRKWLDSGVYVKVMDFYNAFFR
ncbi:MAG: hypothetical protein ACTSPY_16175 [Candidatus Helarchaeota archaeon]